MGGVGDGRRGVRRAFNAIVWDAVGVRARLLERIAVRVSTSSPDHTVVLADAHSGDALYSLDTPKLAPVRSVATYRSAGERLQVSLFDGRQLTVTATEEGVIVDLTAGDAVVSTHAIEYVDLEEALGLEEPVLGARFEATDDASGTTGS